MCSRLLSSLAFSWCFRGVGRPCFCLMRGYVSPMHSRCDYVWMHLHVVGVIVCGYICVSIFWSIPYVIGWSDYVLLSAVSTTTHLHISLYVQPARDP